METKKEESNSHLEKNIFLMISRSDVSTVTREVRALLCLKHFSCILWFSQWEVEAFLASGQLFAFLTEEEWLKRQLYSSKSCQPGDSSTSLCWCADWCLWKSLSRKHAFFNAVTVSHILAVGVLVVTKQFARVPYKIYTNEPHTTGKLRSWWACKHGVEDFLWHTNPGAAVNTRLSQLVCLVVFCPLSLLFLIFLLLHPLVSSPSLLPYSQHAS